MEFSNKALSSVGMLHELLFSLLGFTGDVIIDDGTTFRVKDGFDLLRESEKDLVNRISPLGWYYVHLCDAVQRYDMTWTNSPRKRVYLAAAVQGVADLLAEYVADVAFLEQLVLADGPIPLSQVQQHMQKYLLVLPELHDMLVEVEESGTDGCRILDYFCNYNTGIPVLKEVINRIVLRIRVVFLKQCFAWMIHGELEDPGQEFFIQARSGGVSEHSDNATATLQDKVLETLLRASQQQHRRDKKQDRSVPAQDGAAFDWTSSYSLSLDKIPSSHVSPRIASKIVFAGKAVRLLHTSGALQGGVGDSGGGGGGSIPHRGTAAEYQHSEAYRYLSSGVWAGTETVADSTEDGAGGTEDGTTTGHKDTDRPEKSSHGSGEGKTSEGRIAASVDEQVREAFGAYVEAGGYSVADTQRFSAMFSSVLTEPERAVELLETAVEAVSDCISNRLWVLLRDSCGFTSFLQVIRSTYLLGRGELFQGLLDGILQQTYCPPPEALEMDNILNWRILRTSAKLVGLENDDSLSELLTLRVSSLTLTIRNFAMHAQDVQLVGAAVETTDQYVTAQQQANSGVTWGGLEPPRLGQRTHIQLCRPRPSSSRRQFEDIWGGFIRKRAVGRNTQGDLYTADTDSVQESLVDSLDGARGEGEAGAVGGTDGELAAPQYHNGAVWLADQRPVSKGFDWSATFTCAWTELRAQLHANHSLFHSADSSAERSWNPFAKYGGRVLALGSVSCHLRGDRKHHAAAVVSRSPLPVGAPGSLVVGVVFYGLALPEDRTVRYFARMFMRTGTGSSGVRHTGVAPSGGGHGQGIFATPLKRRALRVPGSAAVGVVGHSADFAHTGMDHSDNELVLSESIIDIDGNLEGLRLGTMIERSISSTSPFRLEVEYARSLQRSDVNDAATVASQRTMASHATSAVHTHAATPAVVYTLRARLVDASLSAPTQSSSASASASTAAAERRFFSHASKVKEVSASVDHVSWGLEVPVNLVNHVKCQGGQAFAGLDASGLKLSAAQDHSSPNTFADADAFAFRLSQLQFSGKGTLSSYPVTSAPTAARHPDTTARVQEEVDRVRAWMHIKLCLHFPPMFRVIFDADAVTCYERVFAAIMKVRLVAHALERLWIARSRLASDRSFCQSRHSMHFFVSNLLYYLQVDVVDSEYSTLQRDIAEAADFQAVLRAHKTFTANVLRLSLIDNLSVQEGIERILHICLRFIAICRIMHRSEFLDVDEGGDGGPGGLSEPNTPSHKGTGVLSDADRISLLHAPIYVPPEELEFIRRDFFAQVSLLFQMMRKVESRGFIFRLDFNNYLSAAASGSVPL